MEKRSLMYYMHFKQVHCVAWRRGKKRAVQQKVAQQMGLSHCKHTNSENAKAFLESAAAYDAVNVSNASHQMRPTATVNISGGNIPLLRLLSFTPPPPLYLYAAFNAVLENDFESAVRRLGTARVVSRRPESKQCKV